MKHYLVTHFAYTDHGQTERLIHILETHYDLWSSDPDAGLYFISSEDSAYDINHHLGDTLEGEGSITLFVFELSANWDGSGNSDTLAALRERLPRSN